jgi:AcrR family transcriptional regulator
MKADLRTTHTKEHIIAEAQRLYKIGGYAQINLDAIAKTLELTRPALYFHFPGGKDQITIEVIKSYYAKMIQQFTEAVAQGHDTRSRIRNFLLVTVYEPLPDHRDLNCAELDRLPFEVRNALQQIFYDIHNGFLEILEAGIHHGELRPVDPEIAFFSFMGLGQQVSEYVTLRQQLPPDFACKIPAQAEEMIDKLLDIWFEGMAAH